MRQLQRGFEVDTRYGGGFVQAINGVAGGRRGGRPVDWFFYVNGIEASEGAAARELEPGDDVWWDHHDWGATMRVPAVVGAFPEPFVSGLGGKKFAVRIGCAAGADDVCDEVEQRLQAEGVQVGGRSTPGGFGGEGLLRVQVGRWADLRKEPATRELEKGPQASGVFARPSAAGDSIALLDARGRVERRIGAGGGLVAATALRDEAPTWVITGTDAVGLAAAAAQLEPDAAAQPLRDRGGGRPRRAAAAGAASRRRRDLPPPREPAARRPRGGRVGVVRGAGRRRADLRAPARARRPAARAAGRRGGRAALPAPCCGRWPSGCRSRS